MKPSGVLTIILISALAIALPKICKAEGNWFYDVELLSSGLVFSPGLFWIKIRLEEDGKLDVEPDWIREPEDLPFDQMLLPPRLRITNADGWIFGQFALIDGQWSPLFSTPFTGSEKELTKLQISLESASVNYSYTVSDSIESVSAARKNRLEWDPLKMEIFTPTKEIPIVFSSSRLVLHIDAAKGNDQFDGKEKFITGACGPKQTFRAVADIVRQAEVKEVEIIMEAGTYEWSDLGSRVEEIILTPIGDVILNIPNNKEKSDERNNKNVL